MKRYILAIPIISQAVGAGMLSLAYFDHRDTVVGWIAFGLLIGMLVSLFVWKELCDDRGTGTV